MPAKPWCHKHPACPTNSCSRRSNAGLPASLLVRKHPRCERATRWTSSSTRGRTLTFLPLMVRWLVAVLFSLEQELVMKLPSTGGSQGIPMSTDTPLPEIGVLIHALSGIIQRAARARDLTVPGKSAPLPPNIFAGRFPAQHSGNQDLTWPRFPAVLFIISQVLLPNL